MSISRQLYLWDCCPLFPAAKEKEEDWALALDLKCSDDWVTKAPKDPWLAFLTGLGGRYELFRWVQKAKVKMQDKIST